MEQSSVEEKLILSKFGKFETQENLKKLDDFLQDKSYMDASQACTKLDAEAYKMTMNLNLEGFSNVIRWRKHIASFENEFAILKAGSF